MTSEAVIILDLGSPYTHLIARRIREERVYSRILPFNTSPDELKEAKAIILSGGLSSVYDQNSPQVDPKILELGIPILGICYGMQWLVHTLGGKVTKAECYVYSRMEFELANFSSLFTQLPRTFQAWMGHGDEIEKLPEGFEVIGKTLKSLFAAIADHKRKIFGLQFHPEATWTHKGSDVIRNFLFLVSFCHYSWDVSSLIEPITARIKERVGQEKIVCALSGGVNSSTLTVLLHKAIGNNLHCVFINNGLLKKGEPERVIDIFRNHYQINLSYVDAQERFLFKLIGVEDSEEKRRIIREEFIAVLEEEMNRIGGCRFLAQKTLYSDVTEGITKEDHSATRRTRWNIGRALMEKMHLELIEPFQELFMEEVRLLAKELGLPDEIIWQHPFPGPGLAIRIVGEVTRERRDLLRDVEWIIDEEIKNAGLYHTLWQVFGVLLPIKATIGVTGDKAYEYAIALRAVTGVDAVMVDWAELPYQLLSKISGRIIREIKGVKRVVYDLTSKPPGTIEWK